MNLSKLDLEVLDRIWTKQQKFSSNFIPLGKLDRGQKETWTKEITYSIIRELTEIVDQFGWKPHRKETYNTIVLSNIEEGLIDVFKFWNILALIWGMDPKTFLREWERKTEVVEQRYKQEFEVPFDKEKFNRFVICDIDGVLCDWIQGITNFIQTRESKKIPPFKGDSDFYEHVGSILGHERAYQLKHEFRASGEKMNLKPISGAYRFLTELQSSGAYILLMSARPYQRYKRIMADTISWLRLHQIPFHGIMWEENKEERIIRDYPEVDFVIEDSVEGSLKLARRGIRTFVRRADYNYLSVDKVKCSKFEPFVDFQDLWERIGRGNPV